jgi:tetratricopeptide (TPR) repeat protein
LNFIYARTLETLAILREAQSRTPEATEIYARAVAESERLCGFPSQTVAEVLYRQSGYFLRMGDLESGEKAIRRAISAMDDIEELLDGEKADYLATLASILEPSGRHAEAEELRKRSKELFARAEKYGEPHE